MITWGCLQLKVVGSGFFQKSKCRFQENISLLSSPFTVYLGITHVPECFSFQQHPRNQTTKWLSETNHPKGCQNLAIKELSEPNNERVLRIKQAKGSQNQTSKGFSESNKQRVLRTKQPKIFSERNNQRVVRTKQPKGFQNQTTKGFIESNNQMVLRIKQPKGSQKQTNQKVVRT